MYSYRAGRKVLRALWTRTADLASINEVLISPIICFSLSVQKYYDAGLVLRCWSSKPIKINIQSNCSRLLLDLNYLFKLQERCTQYNSERYKRKYSTAGDTAKINEPLKKNVLVLEVEIKLEWVFFPPFSHTHYKHNPTPHTHTNTKPV